MPLLDVQHLSVELQTRSGVVHAVNDVSFSVDEGEILGIVGESGSGKSITCRAILGLLPQPAGRITAGRIYYNGKDLVTLSEAEMRALRGSEICIVPQDPNTSLNPVFTTGNQVAESLRRHLGLVGHRLQQRSSDLLQSVRIPAPRERLKNYPHELSGGMRQRVVSAIAISGEPRLILADEPTTALDATTEVQYLDLLLELRERTGVAVIFVTHDFGVVTKVCDSVAIMYAGQIVEKGTIDDVFQRPAHWYTKGLLASVPPLHRSVGRLVAIPGEPPALTGDLQGCPFAPRCGEADLDLCSKTPVEVEIGPGHSTRCWKPAQ